MSTSKKEQAQAIYDKMVAKGASRADIIAAFCSTLQMTAAGAATYYANSKNASGQQPAQANPPAAKGSKAPVKTPPKKVVSTKAEESKKPVERIVHTCCIPGTVDGKEVVVAAHSFYEKADAFAKMDKLGPKAAGAVVVTDFHEIGTDFAKLRKKALNRS